jgi:hypothetical protein
MLLSVGLSSSGIAPKDLTAARIQTAFDQRGQVDWKAANQKLMEFKSIQQQEKDTFAGN